MFTPDLVINAVMVAGRSGVPANNQPALAHDHPSVRMLSRVAVLSAFFVAVYSKKPEAWNLFYVTVAIATVRFVVNLIAIRRKFSKLVLPSRHCEADDSPALRIRCYGAI